MYLPPSIILRYNSPLFLSLLNCSYFDYCFLLEGLPLSLTFAVELNHVVQLRSSTGPFCLHLGSGSNWLSNHFSPQVFRLPLQFYIQLENWPVFSELVSFLKHLTQKEANNSYPTLTHSVSLQHVP